MAVEGLGHSTGNWGGSKCTGGGGINGTGTKVFGVRAFIGRVRGLGHLCSKHSGIQGLAWGGQAKHQHHLSHVIQCLYSLCTYRRR